MARFVGRPDVVAVASGRRSTSRRRRLLVGLLQLVFLLAFNAGFFYGVWRYVIEGAAPRWHKWLPHASSLLSPRSGRDGAGRARPRGIGDRRSALLDGKSHAQLPTMRHLLRPRPQFEAAGVQANGSEKEKAAGGQQRVLAPSLLSTAWRDAFAAANLSLRRVAALHDPSRPLRSVRVQPDSFTWAKNHAAVTRHGHRWCALQRDIWSCVGARYVAPAPLSPSANE